MRILVLPRPRNRSIILFAIFTMFLISVFQFEVVPTQGREPYSMAHTQEKVVALTFDDGPDPSYTGPILDILKEKQVSATFFCLRRRC